MLRFMRLGWNEVKARASAFSQEWRDAHYEKGEAQSFYNDFFEIFGVKRRRVAIFESQVSKLTGSTGFIDLFWRGVLLVEHKSAGRSLDEARAQADDYCSSLESVEHPKFILVCDFQNFILYDLDTRAETAFALADLSRHVEAFAFIMGIQKRELRPQDPVNIQAAELVANVHDALENTGFTGHDLEQFLVRLVFCLFADDTGIFESRDIFYEYLQRTLGDGSNLGTQLTEIFQILDTPENKRQSNLDQDLAQFPYVNGDLFNAPLRIPSCDSPSRARILAACRFDWGGVSPAIFGALFQGVMDKEKRRQLGAHYTGEADILKVIEPLFMDDLHAEFTRLANMKNKSKRMQAMQAFHERLGQLRIFDPACGCGNFLIIAYRELRRLEIALLKKIHPEDSPVINVDDLSKIDVDQFYGIEIDEFASRIAETSLWMMDHLMNIELSAAFGQSFARIPLKKSPHIHHDDALEMDWESVLPAAQCSYILGNPPFSGAKLQSKQQRAQVHRIAGLGKSGGTLDYVTAWFLKAGEYLQNGHARIGFVASNSITQGEQVGQLWNLLFERYKLEISFAHRSFVWTSEARGKAHVFVVIIGLTRADMAPKQKRLFSYIEAKGKPSETQHDALSPYLIDASGLCNRHLVVDEVPCPINDLPKLIMGSKAIDDGNYIFDKTQRAEFLHKEPRAKKYFRPFMGAREFIDGGERWILSLQKASPAKLRKMPEVIKRIKAVREFREKSKSIPTQELAKTPTLYHLNVIPDAPFLVIPRVSTPRREYIPMGWLQPPIIPSDATLIVSNAPLDLFGILTSAMHMAWMRTVAGRLGNGYRYSAGVVYNTFPMPKMTRVQKTRIARRAQAVLDARERFPNINLADLYDPNTMPPPLRRAHISLDNAVDRLYRKQGFASERERIEHLFACYEKLIAPIL